MSKNNEIRNLANEIMDLIIDTSTGDVCIECQKEMMEEMIRERISEMKGVK